MLFDVKTMTQCSNPHLKTRPWRGFQLSTVERELRDNSGQKATSPQHGLNEGSIEQVRSIKEAAILRKTPFNPSKAELHRHRHLQQITRLRIFLRSTKRNDMLPTGTDVPHFSYLYQYSILQVSRCSRASSCKALQKIYKSSKKQFLVCKAP